MPYSEETLPRFESFGQETAYPYNTLQTPGNFNLGTAGISRINYRGIFTDHQLGSDPYPKLGAGRLHVQALPLNLGIGLGLPFISRMRPPADAKLKLGAFYLDVPQTDFTVLYSDNANRSEDNPEQGIIGISTTDISASWQYYEDLRLSLNGRFVYLPFQGRAGFEGFGIQEPLEARVMGDIGPLFLASMDYAFLLGDWEVMAWEDFRVENQRYTGSSARIRQQLDLLEDSSFSEVDQIGRYSYGGFGENGFTDQASATESTLEERYTNTSGMVMENHLGISASRLLPTQTICDLTAIRSDYWYENQQNEITWSDGFSAQLISARANLRFKPLMIYTATENSRDLYWTHVYRAGLFGPVSNYIDFYGDIGHTLQGDAARTSSSLWHLSLRHNPTPTILHQITWERTLTQPEGALATILGYYYHQALGPRLTGILLCEWRETETHTASASRRNERSTGVRLIYRATAKWQLRLSGISNQVKIVSGTAAGDDYTEWIGRSDLEYALSPDSNLTFSLEHTDRNSSLTGDSYMENLLILRLTKYFH